MRGIAQVLAGIDDGTYLKPTRASYRESVTQRRLPIVKQTKRPTTAGAVRADTREARVAQARRDLAAEDHGAATRPSLQHARQDALTEFGSPGGGHRLREPSLRTPEAPRPANPRHARRRASAPRKRTRVWSPQDVHTFLEHTKAERLAALWRFLALTGCRRGEVLGLTWYALVLDARTVRIERQLVTLHRGLALLPPSSS